MDQRDMILVFIYMDQLGEMISVKFVWFGSSLIHRVHCQCIPLVVFEISTKAVFVPVLVLTHPYIIWKTES